MTSLFSVQGVAVVVGGARGIGAEMLDALAEAGADVAAADILEDLARETATAVAGRRGVRGAGYRIDVTERDDVERAFAAIERELGPISVLVAAAGIAENVPAETTPPQLWKRTMAVNLDGVFYCAQAAGTRMLERGRGSIITIASMSGLIVNRPQPQAAYNASKAGVIGLTRSLAAEWAPHGVRVNAIAPGYIRTALTEQTFIERPELLEEWERHTPLGRTGTTQELRGPAVFLACEAASFVTGTTLVVDGGYTVW